MQLWFWKKQSNKLFCLPCVETVKLTSNAFVEFVCLKRVFTKIQEKKM